MEGGEMDDGIGLEAAHGGVQRADLEQVTEYQEGGGVAG